MDKLTMPISQHFAKPIIDFIATKLEIMKRIDANNQLRSIDETLKEEFPRIGGGIKTTAEKLIQLLIKKMKKGESNGSSISFTYSYFIQHVDGRVQKSALKQHFIRLCTSCRPILSKRCRGLLTLPSRIINCITIEFTPGVIQFTSPAKNKVQDMDFSSTPTPRKVSLNLNPNNPQKSTVVHSFAQLFSEASKNSTLFSSFLKPT